MSLPKCCFVMRLMIKVRISLLVCTMLQLFNELLHERLVHQAVKQPVSHLVDDLVLIVLLVLGILHVSNLICHQLLTMSAREESEENDHSDAAHLEISQLFAVSEEVKYPGFPWSPNDSRES